MRRLHIILLGASMLAACQLGPKNAVISATPDAAEPQPVMVATALISETRTGPRVNQWGGVIPDAKPSVPVDDGGLGEIR